MFFGRRRRPRSLNSRNPDLISPNRLFPVIRSSPTGGVSMSLVMPSVSQNFREIRRMPRPYFPKSQIFLISRNPDLISPNRLFPVIRSSPTGGVSMSLVMTSVSQHFREIRRIPRPYFPKSPIFLISRNPDLISPNSLFPVI